MHRAIKIKKDQNTEIVSHAPLIHSFTLDNCIISPSKNLKYIWIK